jgi:rhodanese-related sulfurtransferase
MPPETQTATTSPHVPAISRDELRQGLKTHALTVIDVLPAESYAAGHIPGAISLPLASIAGHARELLPDLNADLAVYCAKFT